MIRQYDKSEDKQLSPDFRLAEFHCKCTNPECITTYVSDDLVTGLQELRDILGPLTITSGFRCHAHNEAIGGSLNSQHLYGRAADIQSLRVRPIEIQRAAKRVLVFSNGGIGFYPSWVHVDARGVPARW